MSETVELNEDEDIYEMVDVARDVSEVSSSFGRNSVSVEVTYVFDGEECVEEFSFDLPSDESGLSVKNDLVRFILLKNTLNICAIKSL